MLVAASRAAQGAGAGWGRRRALGQPQPRTSAELAITTTTTAAHQRAVAATPRASHAAFARRSSGPLSRGGAAARVSASQQPPQGSSPSEQPRRAPPPLAGAAGAGTAVAADAAPGGKGVLSLPVYIEDTDCYAVVFYATYFKFFERGRQHLFGHGLLAALQRDEGLTLRVLGISRGKWASPAVLGDQVQVQTNVVSSDGTVVGLKQEACDGKGKTHVSAILEAAFCDRAGKPVPVPAAAAAAVPALAGSSTPAALALPSDPDALEPYGSGPLSPAVTRVTMFADEVGSDGRATEVGALRWFERNRTDCLGGAAGLKDLQDRGYIAVVALGGKMRFSPGRAPVAGGEVEVRSAVEMKRRNTTIVFHQEAWCQGELVARGDITCMCIDAVSMTPAPCPDDVVARLVPE